MEGGEQGVPSATAAASTAGDPTASPPPLDDPVSGSDPATVSDDVPESEIHALISDDEHGDDHDHDHDHDHEHDHLDEDQDRDHAAVTGVSLDDLKIKIIKQVEYYFSDENLPTDKYLSGFVKRNKEGFVPISVIASFKKMKKLTRDHSFIVAALKESSLLAMEVHHLLTLLKHQSRLLDQKCPMEQGALQLDGVGLLSLLRISKI